jgi:hypothetical protein
MRIHSDDSGYEPGQLGPRPTWAIAHCACCSAEQRFDGDFVEWNRAARAAGWALRVGEFNVDLCPACATKPKRSTDRRQEAAIGDLFG